VTFKFTFLDAGPNPQCIPEAMGKDLDLSGGNPGCCFNVPNAASRCGVVLAECETCHALGSFTVAGRADDPRTLKLACRKGVD
jgi:hypothetical protein